MQKLKTLAIVVTSGCLLACSSRSVPDIVSTATLGSIQSMRGSKANQSTSALKTKNIRVMAVKETALSLGAQSGLANRAKEINAFLAHHARHLDKVFNFESLILENNVLPPVLLEGRNTLNLASPETIRVSDRTYKIDKQARFVTTAPNWRQFIWLDYHLPEPPDKSVLPRTPEEQRAWVKYTKKGWQKGKEQADVIFADNLARLRQDYTGMIRYKKLLAMNMVSPPYVARTDLGVTGDSNQIHIDDRTLRITALPGLKPNSSEWRASVGKQRDRLAALRDREALASESINITDEAWQPVIQRTIPPK